MVGIINFYRSTTWSYFIRSKTQFICDRGKGKGEMEWLASIPFETPVGVYFYWCILHDQLAWDDSSYIFHVMIFFLPVLTILAEEEQWKQIEPVIIHSLAAAWIILRWRHKLLPARSSRVKSWGNKRVDFSRSSICGTQPTLCSSPAFWPGKLSSLAFSFMYQCRVLVRNPCGRIVLMSIYLLHFFFCP